MSNNADKVACDSAANRTGSMDADIGADGGVDGAASYTGSMGIDSGDDGEADGEADGDGKYVYSNRVQNT